MDKCIIFFFEVEWFTASTGSSSGREGVEQNTSQRGRVWIESSSRVVQCCRGGQTGGEIQFD